MSNACNLPLKSTLFFLFSSSLSVPQRCLVSEVGRLDNEIIPNKTGIRVCNPPWRGDCLRPGPGFGLRWARLISAIRAQLAWLGMPRHGTPVEGLSFAIKRITRLGLASGRQLAARARRILLRILGESGGLCLEGLLSKPNEAGN